MDEINDIGQSKNISLQDLYPLWRRRNGTPSEDDGGIGLTTSAIEKLSLQVLYPPWEGTPTEDDGGIGYDIGNRKIIAAGPIPPSPRRRNGTPTEDDGGIELTTSAIEKLSLQVLYPRGGGVNESTSMDSHQREIIASDPNPPWRGRNGTPTEDDGGIGLYDIGNRKIIAAGPIPPAGEETGLPMKGRWGSVYRSRSQASRHQLRKFSSRPPHSPRRGRVNIGNRKIIAAGPIPPAAGGNGTPTEDDGGIELTTSAIEKLSLQVLYPPPARKRDSDEGRWGWGQRCRPQWYSTSAEKLSLQSPIPPSRAGNGTPTEDDGGRVNDIGNRKIIDMQLLYPLWRRRNGTPTEDDGGIELTTSAIEKLSLQVLYPPAPEETGLRRQDDGGGVRYLISTSDRKIIASGPNPPWRRRKRDSDSGRWGYRVNDDGNRKIIAAGPIPPNNAFRERNCSPLYKPLLCSLIVLIWFNMEQLPLCMSGSTRPENTV